MTTTFSVGQTVTATFVGKASHQAPVTGVVTEVRETSKGSWYDVEFDIAEGVKGSKSFRAGQLSAV